MVRHLASKVNEVITGDYDYLGKASHYSDTDSVASNSAVTTSNASLTIEQLFENCSKKIEEDGKEYAIDPDLQVLGFNAATNEAEMQPLGYVYRHKVCKRRFRITDIHGHSVEVTEDHSVMVYRDGKLVGVTPGELKKGDQLILAGESKTSPET